MRTQLCLLLAVLTLTVVTAQRFRGGDQPLPGLGNFGKETLCKLYKTQKETVENQLESLKTLLTQARAVEKLGKEIVAGQNTTDGKAQLKLVLQQLVDKASELNQPLIQMTATSLLTRLDDTKNPSANEAKTLEFVVNRFTDLLDRVQRVINNNESTIREFTKLIGDKNC